MARGLLGDKMTKQDLKNRVLEIWYHKLASAKMRRLFWQNAGDQRGAAICANEETILRLEIDLIQGDKWGYSRLLLASQSSRY